MARESKEQKLAREVRERLEQAAKTAVYRANVPVRLVAAQALATMVGLQTSVALTETGPSVRFYDPYNENGFEEFASYQMEEWELDHLEGRLQSLKQEQEDRILRRKQAEATWEKLTPVERACIKEFIHYLHT